MLAQAEHDPLAAVVAVTTVSGAARDIVLALETGLATHPRADICRAALAGQGAVLSASSLADAIAFANEYAAEHLLLIVESATRWRRFATREPCSSARRRRSRSATT